MADRRPKNEKPKGSGNPNRINRLLTKKAADDYGKLTNMVVLVNLKVSSEQNNEIRAGLHTGECKLSGAAVRGIAVHTGARVASVARAGEVLVSSTVRDLVAGSGIEFADRGMHELKGIPGEWRLYAVT